MQTMDQASRIRTEQKDQTFALRAGCHHNESVAGMPLRKGFNVYSPAHELMLRIANRSDLVLLSLLLKYGLEISSLQRAMFHDYHNLRKQPFGVPDDPDAPILGQQLAGGLRESSSNTFVGYPA